MSTTTLCPTCNTRFKISHEQLEAYNGLVRCGRCQAVFDARENLQDDSPSPQLDLPILADWQRPAEDSTTDTVRPGSGDAPARVELPAEIRSAPITQAQKVTFANLPADDSLFEAPPEKPRWPLVSANVLLLLVLLGQCAYFYRIQLAASMPGLKPALVSYCSLFRCTVPLPRKVDLMSIESSDLEADPAQPSIITLNAILRNHARYAQAFPNLELTLTDEADRPVARRTFSPAEYLGPGNDEQLGLPPSRELNVALNLDTTDLKASGYKLFIY